MSSRPAGGAPDGTDLYPFYAARLTIQGPEHPATVVSLWRLLVARLRHRGPGSAPPVDPAAVPSPSDLPPGLDPETIRLDGDHADTLAGALVAAVEWQEWCVQRYGPDEATTLVATVLLAHRLAAADQLDGQLDSALVLIEQARDGLADLSVRTPDAVTATDLRVAEAVHHWILRLTGEEPRY